VTRGRGITVHTTTCPKALDTEAERKIEVKWNPQVPVRRQVKIKVLSHDMPGILADMSQAISGCGVNIYQANIRTTKDQKSLALFEVEVNNVEQLSRVISALEAKKCVINVERVKT
jgi:GTP pyrophosphokinase